MAQLQDLMLAIADHHKGDGSFGKTRAFKEAFWIDALHYGMTGQTITGCEYLRLPNGPVPDVGMKAFDKLIESGRAYLQPVPTPSGMRQKIVPSSPVENQFTDVQNEIIAQVASVMDGKTAKQVSDHSHDVGPWKFAKPGEPVNMNIVFVDFRRRPTDWEKSEALNGILGTGSEGAIQAKAG